MTAPTMHHLRKSPVLPLLFLLLLQPAVTSCRPAEAPQGGEAAISKSAAESCDAKVKQLESFEAEPRPGAEQTTRITESEINSYLEFNLREKYHPSLRSLRLTLNEGSLRGQALIDFDKLAQGSTNTLTQLIAKMFSGVRELEVSGVLIAGEGKAHFKLQEAQFDGRTLPNALVEEVITAVGRRQDPPFDPMQPSEMPYLIERVDVFRGYIIVRQQGAPRFAGKAPRAAAMAGIESVPQRSTEKHRGTRSKAKTLSVDLGAAHLVPSSSDVLR